MKPRLGVNIDHVATIRQCRDTKYPDPVQAAVLAELGGADQITIHLREDRRHIQDRDLTILKQTASVRLNLEMAVTDEMIAIAKDVKPDMVTLVPEKREERTTEGGLDVVNNKNRIKEAICSLEETIPIVSLFVDPSLDTMETLAEVGSRAIEIHTGFYADAPNLRAAQDELKKISAAVEVAKNQNVKVFAGHGLHYQNILPLLQMKDIEEYNIGHTIIGKAIFVGLERAVREMKEIIQQHYEGELPIE